MLAKSAAGLVSKTRFQNLVTPENLNHGELNARWMYYRVQHGLETMKQADAGYSVSHSYHNLQEDTALVGQLTGCAKHKDLQKGCAIHADVWKKGVLKSNVFVGNALINMYAKCGALAKAQEVFNELLILDVVSWTALIAGYAQHRQGEEALHCFECMQEVGLFPDATTFACVLKACGIMKSAQKGKEIHAEIVRLGLVKTDCVLGNSLMAMYIKCEELTIAQEVFNELPVQTVVSWTMLIVGYYEYGDSEEAVNRFEQMQRAGLFPNASTLAIVLKACGNLGAVEEGKTIHVKVVREGLLEKESVLGNALVYMYAKSGALTLAQEVFGVLSVRDEAAWDAVITGYCKYGNNTAALNHFGQMQCDGFSPSASTLLSVLQACGSTGAVEKGQHLHAQIVRDGLLREGSMFGNALIDMYAKCSAFAMAHKVFYELAVQDVVSWTSLIGGYALHGHNEKALSCFERMQQDGLCPDAMTFACLLKACGSIGAVGKGEEIYAEIDKKGLLAKNLFLGNAAVDFYAKCGALGTAQQLFDELPGRDVVSWNVLIAAYTQQGHHETAIKLFKAMQHTHISPDVVTYACIVKTCSSVRATEMGKAIHVEIVQKGMLEKSCVLGSVLVNMYAKFDQLETARQVLDELPGHNIVAWTALIEGYIEHEQGRAALDCYEKISNLGLSPNAITLLSVLHACGDIGAIEKGKKIHAEIARRRLLEVDIVHSTALVDMYGKCGALAEAQEVFNELPVRNVVSWTALMAGYGQVGRHETVLESFSRMMGEGIRPNEVTFIIVLNACGYLGLVEEGQMHFASMSAKYGLLPNVEHRTCMVDLFGRAGHFEKAMSMIKEIPSSDFLPAWFTLLGSCQKWGNVKGGRAVFKQVMPMDEKLAIAEEMDPHLQEDSDTEEAFEAPKQVECYC